MKILYLVYFDGGGRGGHVTHAHGIVGALASSGNELCILGPGWRGHAPATVRVRDVWQWRKPGMTTISFAFAALPKFVWELWKHRPACVYARYFNLLFLFAFVARLFRVSFFAEHNADLQAEHKMYRRGPLSRALHNFAERTLLANCTGSIVVTQSLLESWQARYGAMDGRTIVIRNGVNSATYLPRSQVSCRRELNLDEAGPYVCYVGAFGAVQGIRFLLEAFEPVRREYPSAKLLLVGGRESELGKYRAEIARLGLDASVVLVGQVTEQVAAKYIGAADICAAPYDCTVALRSNVSGPGAPMKGDPLKIYSYMSCARPVVASHFREAGQYVEQIGAGVAVPPEDVPSLSSALLRLLDDEQLRLALGATGRAHVERFATWEIAGGKTLQFMADRMAAQAGRH